MELVKVSSKFFDDCKAHGTDDELLFNEGGRPNVLLVKMHYKGNQYDFVIPLRSNISPKAKKEQYFSLPTNSKTKQYHHHGVHYIKLFPIKDEYIEAFKVTKPYDKLIQSILFENEKEIVDNCQKYLIQCELGNRHFMTPDIDGIISWLY